MKKIAIVILVLGIALSYSCKKEEKRVSTTITGTLIVNGTNDPIKISKELKKPQVVLYYRHGNGVLYGGGPQWDEVARTSADENAKFSFQLDLISGGEYFLVFADCDPDLYVETINGYNTTYFPVTPGQSNSIKLYVLAYSWVRPRFINTNPDVNNVDVFRYVSGLPPIVYIDPNIPQGSLVFTGLVDTTLGSIHKTWSGTYRNGVVNTDLAHKVNGKLTRNGVTRDTSIIYTVPPFDTTVVEIRY